ncbi:major capsid protein [Tabrizicola soli]|uniref:Major capsid protein n=1 Tax=Tabrizicola soli TaxID=2185115 RepID=A0ABV7DZF4_9RHOB|nr:major capsid protein [Tabrizicola soli]
MFNKDEITLQTLTASVNKVPFVETTLSRFFRVGRIRSTQAIVEASSTGLTLIDPSARGVAAPNATGLGPNRGQYVIQSVKLGRVVNIAAADFQDVRAFGSESLPETFDEVLGRNTATVRRWIEHTHENFRFNTLKGKQVAADGVTVLTDFYALAGVDEPDEVEVDLATATRAELQNMFADMLDYSRSGLGIDADSAQAYVVLYGKNAWRAFRNNDAVAALYDRFQDGAVNRQGVGGQRANFELFDLVHVQYFGAIGDDEFRLVPAGVPDLFRTDFTPLDAPEAANTLGLPLYATPEIAPFGKGYAVELASLPIHYVTRPECLIGGRHVPTVVTP